jgi:hypothetical protein
MTAPRLAAGLLLVLAACGGPAAPWTEAPAALLDLKIAVTPQQVELLQPVTVVLDRWRRDGIVAEFAPKVAAEDFDTTTEVAAERPLLGGHWQRTTLRLLPLRGPGRLVLPSFVVQQTDGAAAASTPEQTIEVLSSLAGAAPAIEAPGEPFPTPFRGWWWIFVGAGLAAVAWWAIRRAGRRSALASADTVALPPHVKAHRALQRLHKAARTTPAEIEAFYVDVSAVLRTYLEERFGVRAPERTTEEFLRELDAGSGPLCEHRRELARFLGQCDLVKFAAQLPTENDHLATWALATALVEATRSDRVPSTADGAAVPAEVRA